MRRQDTDQLWGSEGGAPAIHGSAACRDGRALPAVMGHYAFDHWAHPGSGDRPAVLPGPPGGEKQAGAVGLHHTTVKRCMDRLVEDGVDELTDSLYYLSRNLADEAGAGGGPGGVWRVAQERGAEGLGSGDGNAMPAT
ncbi:hypothetical protein [Streptomyces syringium]|uniref:hypothetical protein n=1 Tax=Streptomyces syringium TaxID=76729 RepID=UPI0034088E1D